MASENPLVTICVAVYNGYNYLQASLDGIHNQSYPNVELIICDDASTDSSYDLCRAWMTNCSRPCKLLRNEKNKGLTATCNILLAEASGKYITFVDQDDIILPGKISEDIDFLETQSPETAAVFSPVTLINEKGEFLEQRYFDRICFDGIIQEPLFPKIVRKNFITASTVLMRAERLRAVGGFDESLIFQDWDLWLRLTRDYRMVFRNKASLLYRIHSTSMMADRALTQTIQRNDADIRMLKKHFGVNPIYDAALMNKLREFTIYSYYIGDKNAGQKMRSFLKKKWDFKIAFYLLQFSLGLKHPSAYRNVKAKGSN